MRVQLRPVLTPSTPFCDEAGAWCVARLYYGIIHGTACTVRVCLYISIACTERTAQSVGHCLTEVRMYCLLFSITLNVSTDYIRTYIHTPVCTIHLYGRYLCTPYEVRMCQRRCAVGKRATRAHGGAIPPSSRPFGTFGTPPPP